MSRIVKAYIHGNYVESEMAETFTTTNPASNQAIAKCQVSGAAEVDKMIDSANKGFAQWSAMTGTQRSRIMLEAVRILRSRNRELAELEVQDTGKPIQEADVVDVHSGADCIEYFAGLAPGIGGEQVDLGSAFFYTRREPLGICLGIGAWNYPIQIACWKSAPALACGNAMIFKPSEVTPLTALKLAEIYTEAGVPDGVFNVALGAAETGQLLLARPEIAKVSLTGSVATGKKVMQGAAKTLKQVTMELGGKSPLIIFADCDLDNAVSAALLANFYTQGEICTNGTRVFVEQTIQDEFIAKLLDRTGKMKVGDPMHPDTHVGAMIHAQHMAKVMGYIQAGKQEGANLIYGGDQVTVAGLEQGCFMRPAIFTDCNDDMSIVKQEIFGPVMSVLSFNSEDEVIQRANNTEMGLAAGVFTNNLQRAHRVVAKLQAGVCWINNYNITPIEMPFGGYKQSGIGRENGHAAIEHYSQLKSVYVELGDVTAPY